MAIAVARNRRKDSAILESAPVFSALLHSKNYEAAAKVAFATALEVDDVEGIMGALRDANSFYRRRNQRKGL